MFIIPKKTKGVHNLYAESTTAKNSKIFKTFDNNIDKWTAKIGILGKSFNELGTAIKSAFESSINNIDNLDEDVGFWKSLKNNLFPNKEDIQSQLWDVMPEININNVEESVEIIKDLNSLVADGSTTWQELFDDILPPGEKHFAQLGQQMEGQIITEKGLIEVNKAARESALAHNAAIQQQTLSAKAGQVAMKGLAIAGNMLLFMVISEGIQLAVKAIDNYVHRVEKIKEAAKEAKSAIDEIKSDFESLSSTTDEVKERYAELAQGVKNLGKINQSRGKLSTDDYEEFLGLSNQLADLFPKLTVGYDDNGNAILNLSGSVNTIVSSLNNLVDVQQKLANQEIIDKMPEVWSGYIIDFKKNNEELDINEKAVDDYLNLTKEIQIPKKQTIDFSTEKYSNFSSAIEIAGIDWNTFQKALQRNWSNHGQKSIVTSYTLDLQQLTEDQKEALSNALGGIASDYERKVQKAKDEISTANADIENHINTWLSSGSGGWSFSKMDSNLQNVVKDVLFNSDWVKALPEDVVCDWDKVAEWLQGELLYAINDIDNEEIEKALFDAFNDMFTIESLQELINQLTSDKYGFTEDNPLIIYLQTKLTDAQVFETSYSRLLNDAAKRVSGATDRDVLNKTGNYEEYHEIYDKIDEFAEKYSIDTQDEIVAFQDALEEANYDIEKAFEIYLDKLDNETPDLSFTEAISQVQSLSKGLDQLDKIYADVYDKGDFDWSSMLNNQDFKDVFGNFTNEYNDFIETVANSPDDIDACQSSFDKLATAFINNSDAMKNLSDETKETTIRMLEQMGIANAEEYVNQYLISSYGDLKNAAEELGIEKQRLSDLTQDEIVQLLNEDSVSEETKNKLVGLYLAQLNLNDNPLDIKASIDNLRSLIGATGETADALAKLANIMDKIARIQSTIESSKNDPMAMMSLTAELAALDGEAALLKNQVSASLQSSVSGKYTGGSSTNKAKDSSSTSSSTSGTSQTYNWLETAINRIEQLISRLKSKADSAYKSWSDRNSNLKQEISAVRNEIDLQQQAYERYMQMANSVGLSESWAEKVRNGQVSIESISDENLADKIKEYEEWYEKALDCQEAMEKLDETVKDLYKTAFDNISSQYDNILSAIEHQKSMLDESISQAEQSSYRSFDENHSNLIKSIGYYKELLKQEQSNVSQLIQERDALTRAFNEAMGNGIEQGSEAWAQMRDKINDVTLAIEKSNTTVLGYHDSISKLFETAFENIESMYGNVLSAIENRKNLLDAAISQTEEKGWLVSAEYYTALMKTEKENLTQLENEKAALLSALNDAVSSGAVKEYTQAWYDMKDRIDDVTIAIEEANTAVIKYGNSIRDIEWSIFDLLNDRISSITSEADFLIDLMSNDRLYDEDTGKLTDEGMATMGLHGVDYNIYMAQADEYAEKLLEIEKKLAENPYDQELWDRRQELLEQQQEMILAAESEKQAIKDMVEEGIKLELDALKELIDTYTDALDSQKDLYDYQKKVSKQTKEIASLQKQLSAYENDLSEEARAKVQQIRVSLETAKEDLEEMEYEKYIADQKKLLDDLYLEYEIILNQRLDNLDALISEMIGQINTSAVDISTTLSEKAESVGYTLSDSMTKIWDTSTGNITQVLTTYGGNISSAVTTVNETLKSINENLRNMISQLNTIADMKIQAAATPASTPASNGNGNSGGGASNQAGSASSQPSSAYLYRKTSPIIMK